MESEKNNYTGYFLPPFFRITGFVIVLISIIILILASLIKTYLAVLPSSHLVLILDRVSIVTGLSLLIFSREKDENENTQKNRHSALLLSLLVSVVLIIILEIINVLQNDVPVYAIDFIIIEMCIYYIIFKLKR